VPPNASRVTPRALSDPVWLRVNHHRADSLWFAATAAQVAEWINDRNSVEQLLGQRAANGHWLARWRGERTASVSLSPDGQVWADHGAGGQRSDGRRDGGDAVTLLCRLRGQTRAEILREGARELVREARTILEDAARAGRPLPAWVHQIVTPAGWRRYDALSAQARARDGPSLPAPETH
jgi:hypothetical protein